MRGQLVSGFLLVALATGACANLVIMPMGDSNTAGYPGFPPAGGYRRAMHVELTRLGVPHTFVGSNTIYASPELPFNGHEGWNGFTTFTLPPREGLETVAFESIRNHMPDLILLQIGTNDLDLGLAPTTVLLKVADLLTQIRATDADVRVAVATLPPTKDVNLQPKINEFNAGLPAIVRANGYEVGIDVAKIVRPFEVWDRLHPTVQGYNRVGWHWAQWIQRRFAPKPLFSDTATTRSPIGRAINR